jgi:hypothetical protein
VEKTITALKVAAADYIKKATVSLASVVVSTGVDKAPKELAELEHGKFTTRSWRYCKGWCS